MDRRPVLILTGEPSGDRAAGRLAEELRRREPDREILAVGGPALRAAGARILEDIATLGAMGFAEVVRQLPRLRRLEERLGRLLVESPPAVVIPVDYPGFNLRIARRARAAGVPVVYYIGPQVWAWGAGRIPRIAESVDRMLVVFPFEEELYREAGMRADYVGHPLLDDLDDAPARDAARAALGLGPDEPVLGLLPGSRAQEVHRVLPVMAQAAALAAERIPGLRVLASAAGSVPGPAWERALGRRAPAGLVRVAGPAAPLVRAADFLLVTSGTATLEAALLGTPLAVLYRTSALTWMVGRRLVRIPRISLVNIVAGEELVAEFLQGDAEPRRVAEHAVGFLGDAARRATLAERLRGLRRTLGPAGTAARAAAAIREEMAR